MFSIFDVFQRDIHEGSKTYGIMFLVLFIFCERTQFKRIHSFCQSLMHFIENNSTLDKVSDIQLLEIKRARKS